MNTNLVKSINLLARLREFDRTIWQLKSLAILGSRRMNLAAEAIATGQCLQRKWELMAMMAAVKRLRPRTVVEIGTYRGGTIRCWADVCPDDTVFISIDLPGGQFGGGYTESDISALETLVKPTQTLKCLRLDSHAESTKDVLLQILAGRKVDFLFIDGDHTYGGVKRDFELHSGLVRKGGLIGLHDIMPHKVHKDCRVHEYWSELRAARETFELVDRDGFETWGGIGVVRV
jgi:predicted O-methyltransferase YrrM